MTKWSNHQSIQTELWKEPQKKRKDMSSEERVLLLQKKLYQKAKQEKEYRFYVLYDRVFLDYVIKESYRQVKQSGGGPGIDGVTFAEIEAQGVETFLSELREDLRTRRYKPGAVERVWIPKANGGQRPLGIPIIRDRVAQMACKTVIEPIFEADFEDCSYGYRPERSAQDAVREVKENLQRGKTTVYDADLSKYFDTIPHEKLMKTLEVRISDPRILHPIKLWLKAPVIEDDKPRGGKNSEEGTSQGGVISPLLANIYLNSLDKMVSNPEGLIARSGIRIVRYADDFVLTGRYISEESTGRVSRLLERMELKINQTKTKVVKVTEEPFDFLGFTIRYDRSIFDKRKRFWQIRPSEKSCKRLRHSINTKLKKIGHYAPEKVADEINRIVRGWLNYYHIDNVSYTQQARRKLSDYLRERLYRYYNRKSQRKTRLHGQQAFEMLVREHGLINPYKASGLVHHANV